MDKQAIWGNALSCLAGKMPKMEFHTWFRKVGISEISGDAVEIVCPTEMNKNWLESRYEGVILSSIRSVLPEISRIFFRVDLALADQMSQQKKEVFNLQPKPRKVRQEPEVAIEPGIHSRITNERFSLNNFIIGEENRLAHAACQAVADFEINKPKKYSPLFIYGGVGLGKTHLLQGIANEVRQNVPEAKIIYTTAERFTNEIVKSIREKKPDEFRKKYRRIDMLIIDDVQFFEGKERTQDELFNTFNDLHEFNKQIVFSSDRPPSQLHGISDRLRSRMEWGLSVDVQLPSYEVRLAIIQEKSCRQALVLPPDVQEFIAANVHRNLREIENILNKISIELDFSQTSPTVETTRKIFRSLNPSTDISTPDNAKQGLIRTTEDVITSIADYFQIPMTELLGISRKKEIVFPRQISWLLCKDILNMSLEAIGNDFGGKNHTTIMHGIDKIRKLIRKDSTTARHIHAIKKDLGVQI